MSDSVTAPVIIGLAVGITLIVAAEPAQTNLP